MTILRRSVAGSEHAPLAYAYILDTEYDYHVSRMMLGQVHPILSQPHLVEVPKLEDHMALLIEDQISRGLAVSEAIAGHDAPFVLPPRTDTNLASLFNRMSR